MLPSLTFINGQTQDHIQRNELLYTYQSGFLDHSIDACLPQVTDLILNGDENEKHIGMTLLDLQKAF